MPIFQEAIDEIKGQLAVRGKYPLPPDGDSAFQGVTLCSNPFLCQHWVSDAPAEGADGWGLSHSKSGDMGYRSVISHWWSKTSYPSSLSLSLSFPSPLYLLYVEMNSFLFEMFPC